MNMSCDCKFLISFEQDILIVSLEQIITVEYVK